MAVLGLSIIAAPLFAQRDRGSLGINVVVGQPYGAFRRNADVAAGVTVYGVPVGRTLGLRIDGSWMLYDYQNQRSGAFTTSQIASIGAGPQLTLRRGPIGLYGFATVGASLFWTSANFGNGCGCYHSDYDLSGDFTTTTSAGGGLLLTVFHGSSPIAFDFGVRGVRHDRVKYVPYDGVSETPDGTFSASRVETPVEMRVFHFGVSIGLR